jgi:hypothetical protein
VSDDLDRLRELPPPFYSRAVVAGTLIGEIAGFRKIRYSNLMVIVWLRVTQQERVFNTEPDCRPGGQKLLHQGTSSLLSLCMSHSASRNLRKMTQTASPLISLWEVSGSKSDLDTLPDFLQFLSIHTRIRPHNRPWPLP